VKTKLLCGAVFLMAFACGGGGGADGGVCSEAANLLVNGSFECGTSGWSAIGGVLSAEAGNAKTGSSSARLEAPSGGAAASLWYDADAVLNPGTKTYCTRAWMRGTAQNGRITVRKVASGAGEDENFSSPVGPDWTLVPPQSYGPLKVTGAGELKFLLRVWIPNPSPGDVLIVDDVQLWESPDGTCGER
jgi:hypothetical protein